MRAGSRAKSRTALLVSVGVVAAAIVYVLLSRQDASPPTGGTEPASAELRGGSTTAGATSSLGVRTAVESQATPPRTEEDATAIMLEVRDSAARLVPGARVTVRDDKEKDVLSQEATDGTTLLPPGVTADAMVGWRATVALAGRVVTEPMRLSRPGVITIGIGDVGTLRITCEGAAADIKLQVTEFRDGEPRGPTGDAKTTRGVADVSVAAGSLQYRVAGYGGLGDGCLVVGPRNQGDVAELHIDLRTCRLTGQLAYEGTPGEGQVWALLIAADETKGYGAELYAEGLFAVNLPRIRFESIVFVRGAMSGVCPPVTLDADERDVGLIRMTARPRLGRLEVRDPQGMLHGKPGSLVYFTTASGARVRGGLSHGQFFSWEVAPDGGLECFAIPGITEVAVSPSGNDMFAEPRVVVIRDGGVFRADLVAGGRVVVLLSAPGRQGLPEMWLEDVSTKERVDRTMATFKDRAAGLQRHEFRGVPPGRYQVCAKGIEIVGGSLEVLGGSDQEITVSVRPQ